jgi:hypothetical protein
MKVPFLSSVRISGITTAIKASAFMLGAVMLFGCPVYSGNQTELSCDSQGQCCDENSGNCYTIQCDYNTQCPYGASCNDGVCSAAYDAGGYYDAGDYDSGDDSATGCPDEPCQEGYTCTLSNGIAQCLPTEDSGSFDAGTDATIGDTGTPDVVTPPSDAGTDAPIVPPFTGCTSDSVCVVDSGAGATCLNGQCVAATNECSDSTQCPSIGATQEECVAGVCTPSCAGGVACPSGYSCQQIGSTSVCTGNPTPCGAADGGAACTSGTTCVDEHCVPDCTAGTGDSGPSCGTSGLVCVDNGCIPSQKPTFVCAGADGTQSTCDPGSTCLHHNCYISCVPGDAGADAGNSCRTAGNFNTCEPVTTSTGGPFYVCGSSSNLGTECDPTRGIACSDSRICIDGTCY